MLLRSKKAEGVAVIGKEVEVGLEEVKGMFVVELPNEVVEDAGKPHARAL